jgi:hypothetical protein
MLPKIASALARVLDPIKPIDRTGQALTTAKSAEGGDGGYGTLGYESQEKSEEKEARAGPNSVVPDLLPEDGITPEHPEKRTVTVPFRPGLTQVILELNGTRAERSAGAAAATYETGAKDQKKNARLPKGSMLDKKVG